MSTPAAHNDELEHAVLAAGGMGNTFADGAAIAAVMGVRNDDAKWELRARLERAVTDGLLWVSEEGGYHVRLPEQVIAVSRSPDGWLDLRGHNLRELALDSGHGPDALHYLDFERVCFGDRDQVVDPADLTRSSFKGCIFRDVWFDHAALADVYFRGCAFERCLLRYVHAVATSFQDATFEDCDFYRAYFEAANILTDARFTRVSLDKAWVAGTIGLTDRSFVREWAFKDRSKSLIGVVRQHRRDVKERAAMVQQCDSETYARFLEMTQGQRPEWHTIPKALEDAKRDVAEVYRSLSGMWTDGGQLRYAGFAYERCKALEREFHSPPRRWRRNRQIAARNRRRRKLLRRPNARLQPDEEQLRDSAPEARVVIVRRHALRWVALSLAWGLANYGESMRRVALWLLALIVLPGIGLWIFGGVQTDATPPVAVGDLPKCLLFSLEQLTASTHHLQPANNQVELLGSLQVFIGVALLGLFGFTLANRLRNS